METNFHRLSSIREGHNTENQAVFQLGRCSVDQISKRQVVQPKGYFRMPAISIYLHLQTFFESVSRIVPWRYPTLEDVSEFHFIFSNFITN